MTNILLLQRLISLQQKFARLKQADLVTKTDFDTELISLNKKNKSNLTP